MKWGKNSRWRANALRMTVLFIVGLLVPGVAFGAARAAQFIQKSGGASTQIAGNAALSSPKSVTVETVPPPITDSIIVIVSTDENIINNATTTIDEIVPPLPTITEQPRNQIVDVGGLATFHVRASYGDDPLSYQWKKDGVDIPGATGNPYSIANVQPSHGGTYTVLISGPRGNLFSTGAVLAVRAPPAIAAHPQNVTAIVGQHVTLDLSVIGGAPLSVQWRKDGQPITAANQTNYSLPVVQSAHAGVYSVVVSNAFGTVTSSNATLQVLPHGPLDHFEVSVNGATQTTGTPIPVNVTARDSLGNVVTAISDTASFTIRAPALVSRNLLGPLAPNSTPAAFIGTTLGYSFTPSQDLVVTHLRHCFGTKVSLWTESGTLLAAQHVTSTPGSWLETPLAAPVTLSAGTSYRVGVFVPAGSLYHLRVTQPAAAPFGTIALPYWAFTDGFPSVFNAQAWPMVDLQFTAQSVTQIGVEPSAPGTFAQGVWAGALTVLETGTNAVLEVTGGGRSGASGEFTILLGAPVITDHPADARRIAGKNLLLSTTASGGGTLAYQWWFNGTAVPGGTSPQLALSNSTEGQSGLYWCSVGNAAGTATSRVARVAVGTAILSHVTAPDVQTIRSSGFELALQMEVGRAYRIEGSTNLVDWVMITNFVSNGEALQFLDRSATNLTRRFYRVVRQ